MNHPLYSLFTLFVCLCWSSFSFSQSISLKSPDGKIVFSMHVQDKKPIYSIVKEGQEVIAASDLGIEAGNVSYNRAQMISMGKPALINQKFAARGGHSKAIHYAKSAVVKVMTTTNEKFYIEVQVFNDGVAFRYKIPSANTGTVTQEFTRFTLPENTIAWWQGDLQNYEGRYRKDNVSDIKDKQVIGLPITFRNAYGVYVAINEAGIEDFAGMHLVKHTTQSFTVALAGNVKCKGDVVSPWRIIQISNNLNTLINSDMIASLSAAPDPVLFPKGLATEWIKPGKSVWSWMTPNRSVTPENMRKFTDLAAQLNIPYNLVDDGWGKWKSGDKDHWQLMKELVDYSKSKNVAIWVWAAYPDNNGLKGLNDSAYMIEFFNKCKAIGIAGMKIDFMSSETQDMMGFYKRALKAAAKLQLMVDFHGVNKPTGLSRTWPNELTREAVRGLEYEENTDYAAHNTILPFTRYLAGDGDYTPMSFQPYVAKTTLAHQVATTVIFTSPLLVLGVDPEALLQNISVDFIKQIPSVWDETIVLPSSIIGEVAGFARRSGSKWFVAILNSKDEKDFSVPLTFLSKGYYNYKSLSDLSNKVEYSSTSVTSKDTLELKLASGGGFVGIFEVK